MQPYLSLAIVLIVLLVVVFVVSYVLNKKTPVPKGCEQLKISEDFCLHCSNEDCLIKEKFAQENLKKEVERRDDK